MTMLKIRDVFVDSYGDTGSCIFEYLQDFDVPWKELDIYQLLDHEYLYNISGERYISPLVRSGIDPLTNTLETAARHFLAELLYNMCGQRWQKLWDTLSFEYNPIENYKMTEEMDGDTTDITYGNTETDTLVHGKTQTRTDNLTEVSETGIQGFNSASYSASDKYTTDNTGTQTYADTGTDTNTKARTGKDTHERNYTLTRSGNIGVTTSQQMIESERALWMWQFFYDVVFPDVNRVLTLSMY